MGIGLNGFNSGIADTYSSLLGGASSSSSGAMDASTLLSDYAAIKNGSYAKMMKAYYAKVKSEDGDTSSSSTSASKTLNDKAAAAASRSLYQSANTLVSLNYDDRSEENIQKITDSVSAFIDDYNSLMKSAAKSDNATVQKQAEALFDSYYNNYELFAKIGITMDADRGLSLNEDTFKKAFTDDKGTVGTIKTLFSGIGSFADKAADRASKIYNAAGDGAAVNSAQAKYAGGSGGLSSISSSSSTSKTSTDASTATLASSLYKSVESLLNMTFSDDDKDSAYDAFSAFIKDYNALIENTDNSTNSNVKNQADYLKTLVSGNKSAFSRIGITVNSDKTLSIDEEKFKDADMSTAQNMFTGVYSFGEKMTDRINQIYRYASQGDSQTGQTYTSEGNYSPLSTGSMLDAIL